VLFKLTWNSFIIEILGCRLYLLSFNIVIAPVLAAMTVDISCFQGLFVPPNTIESSYRVTECLLYKLSETGRPYCTGASELFVTSSFVTPFSYSYQCSSSIIENYVPICIAMYGVAGIIVPLLKLLFCVYANQCDPVISEHFNLRYN
jgi:hypothetical protein